MSNRREEFPTVLSIIALLTIFAAMVGVVNVLPLPETRRLWLNETPQQQQYREHPDHQSNMREPVKWKP